MNFILSILGSIGFNWHVALANFINFLIILFILNKFVFKKVFSGIESRQNVIREGVKNASLAQENLKIAANESQSIILNSKKEAEKIFKDIIDKSELEARAITEKASIDTEKLRTQLKDKISSAQSEIENNFAKVAPDLLAKLFKKVLGDIDEATHNKILVNLIK